MDPKLQEIIGLDEAHFMNTFGKRTPVCFVSGQGSTLTDTAGKAGRYYKFVSLNR